MRKNLRNMKSFKEKKNTTQNDVEYLDYHQRSNKNMMKMVTDHNHKLSSLLVLKQC